MMYMKIEEQDDNIIVYLINTFFSNYERPELIVKIKEIFIRLIEYYNFDLKGQFDVSLYENIKYGTVLEIKKIDELLFPRDIVDIKLKIYKNKNFYFQTDDIFYIKNYQNIYYDGNYYYIDLKDVDNYLNIVEYGNLLYKEKDNYLKNMKLIK